MPISRLKQFDKNLTWQDKLADKITAFCGNMRFVYFHAVWFFIWVVINIIGWINEWDPYPFGLLTLVVSLEAIFLSTFILISQNRQNERSELRAQMDYEVDQRSEREISKIKAMLEEIIQNQKRMMNKSK
ncbi:DUF1003 domain-containing protein [Patescibacteria group bacterium]